MKKAVAYARYSTDKQTEDSIAFQLEEIQKYCVKNKLLLTAIYKDDAQSGTNTDRQGFIEMIDAAKRKEFDCVVIYDVTRGSRDVADWFYFRKTMAALDIKVISATENLGDITDPNEDHPRVCGEQANARWCMTKKTGSPPRVRGADFDSDSVNLFTGITPACAGSS